MKGNLRLLRKVSYTVKTFDLSVHLMLGFGLLDGKRAFKK